MIINDVCYEIIGNIDFRDMMSILLRCKYVIPEDDTGTYRLGTLVDGYQCIKLDRGKIRLHRQNRKYFTGVDLKNQDVYNWLDTYLKLKSKNSRRLVIGAYLSNITALNNVNVLKLTLGDLHTEYIISGITVDGIDNYMLKLIKDEKSYRMYAYGDSTRFESVNTCYNYQVPDGIVDSLEVILESECSVGLKLT